MDYNSNEGIELVEINNGKDNDNESDNENEPNKLLISQDKEKKAEEINVFSSLKYPSLRYKFLILYIIWFGMRSTSNSIALSCKFLFFGIIILILYYNLLLNQLFIMFQGF